MFNPKSWFNIFKRKHNLSAKYYAVGDLAIAGYDPVAYFYEKKSIKGKKEHTYLWNNLTWRFSNAANQERFKQDPLAYAPQFGGYCSWGMKDGYRAKTDPKNAWTIVDGELYLNYSMKYKKLWLIDARQSIMIARENWKKLIHQPEN